MMKKWIAVMMVLCLLGVGGFAMADTEIPVWNKMPAVVIDDGETTIVEESAFFGEWRLEAAFLDEEYVDNERLFNDFDYNFAPYVIGDGKIVQQVQNEYGEFSPVELAYTFEAGELQGEDEEVNFVVDLLEDGNIVMTLFVPGENETVQCLSLFLVRTEVQ